MPTLGQFAAGRIKDLVDDTFGIPGDYSLKFYDLLCKEMNVINTTDEQCAGFAADAYARVKGFGCVCVTYCVGGFKLINPIAGAFAEKSPVLVVSGSPGVKERQSGLLLHHMVGPFESQHNMFKNITCASAVLDDPTTACYKIDSVIETMHHCKQPGYIEIPRDMVDQYVNYDVFAQGTPHFGDSDKENLEEALEKAAQWVNSSKHPVILAGVEIARYNLGKQLVHFAEKANIPIATTLLGKSIVNEEHPLALGVYCGSMSRDNVRKYVEDSDCVIMLGVMQTDINLAFNPLRCEQTNVILASTGRVRIRRSTYERVSFNDFVSQLLSAPITRNAPSTFVKTSVGKFVPETNKKITASRLFQKIDNIITKDVAVVADVGDSMFGAADLTLHHSNQFLAPAFYTSMGFAVPGALGLQTALPEIRPIVIVGDGAFQMTGMELSTIVREKLNPIVFILNNQGFMTERYLMDGEYNDVHSWNYEDIPKLINGGKGYKVSTEEELDNAVTEALTSKEVSVINVMLDKMDATPALKRMMDSLSKKDLNMAKNNKNQKDTTKINYQIKVPKVRVVADNKQLGILSTKEAMKIADEQGLDLVEVAPEANPPVCRIMDYGHYKYEQQKQAKRKTKSHAVEQKEVRFTPGTGEADIETKIKQIRRFLDEGKKVKVSVKYQGRAILHKEEGEKVLEKVIDAIKDVGVARSRSMEGKFLSIQIEAHKA